MTRIVLIAGTYLPERCSIAEYTMHLCANLCEYGVESSVFTTYYSAEAAYDPNAIGVVHGWRLADLFSLVRAVHASKAEILHIQYAARLYGSERAILLLPMMLRKTGWRSPIVTTLHEYESWEPKIAPQPVKWLKHINLPWSNQSEDLLRHSDAVIVTNASTQKAIYNQLPQMKQVFHIPSAANVEVASIDRNIARQLLRENCNWSDDSLVIACFGLHPDKKLEILLAFKQVSITQPSARLLLLDGFESQGLSDEDEAAYLVQLQALVSQLGLSESVHFTGNVSAQTVSSYLTGADIGVLLCDRPTTLNNSSLLTLLAHGLPVVATKSSTLPSAHSVRLIPPDDIAALASELLELLDSDLRTQIGTDIVEGQNFIWQNTVKDHIDIYNYLTNRKDKGFTL